MSSDWEEGDEVYGAKAVAAAQLAAAQLRILSEERDAAIAERDRLRRELEALRDEVWSAHEDADHHAIRHAIAHDHIYARAAGAAAVLSGVLTKLDAILRGES